MIDYDISGATNQTIVAVAAERGWQAGSVVEERRSWRDRTENTIDGVLSDAMNQYYSADREPRDTDPKLRVSEFAETSPTAREARHTHDVELRESFRERLTTWKAETQADSSMTQIVLHPAYQKIIGMGWKAVPLILEELRYQPSWLFWALVAIVDEDPVRPEDRGNLNAMAAAWLRWGAARGITGH